MADQITATSTDRSKRAVALSVQAADVGLMLWYKSHGMYRWSLCSYRPEVKIERFCNLTEVGEWIKRVRDGRQP